MARDEVTPRATCRQRPRALTWRCLLVGLLLLVGGARLLWIVGTTALGGVARQPVVARWVQALAPARAGLPVARRAVEGRHP